VLAALLLLAVGALVWSRRTDDPAAAPTTRPRVTTTRPGGRVAPSTPPPPGVPPSTAPRAGPAPTLTEVQAAVDALVPFVQQRRGLTFTSQPPVTVVDGAAFDDQAKAAFDRQVPVWQRRALLLQVLGAVDGRFDVVAAFRELEPVGRMARYDPASRTIVVRGQPITPYTREQLVGALTAALDDQRFGTDRPAYDGAADEIRWAFEALRVGDATRLADAWGETLTPADRAARDRAEEDAHTGFDPTKLPPAVVELLAFPTDEGSAFASALTGGAAADGPLDGAFADPPHATADVLHPERFLGHVAAVPVPAPAVEGRVLATGVFGELMTVATLADTLAADGAARAAAGWAGDTYVLYEGESGTPCIRIAYKAVSPAALGQLRQAYATWAQHQEGAEVGGDGDTLIVSRCVTGGGRSPA
jgi:hypothetical protein